MTTTGKVQRRVLRERERARKMRRIPLAHARALHAFEERVVRQHPQHAGATVGRISAPS
jgi:hypothetical protein